MSDLEFYVSLGSVVVLISCFTILSILIISNEIALDRLNKLIEQEKLELEELQEESNK